MDNDRMTETRMSEIQARAEKATSGPMVLDVEEQTVRSYAEWEEGKIVVEYSTRDWNRGNTENDAAFLASSFADIPDLLSALRAAYQREAEKDATIFRLNAERDAAIEEAETLKNLETTNYICAVRHYEKYNSRYTFALPHQWYELTLDSFDEYQEFSMQLVYLLTKAREKYEKSKSIHRGQCAANTDAPTGAESEADHAE